MLERLLGESFLVSHHEKIFSVIEYVTAFSRVASMTLRFLVLHQRQVARVCGPFPSVDCCNIPRRA